MAKAQITVEANRVRSVKNKNYYRSRVSFAKPVVKVEHTLPFRIKFTSIGIEGYGPDNPGGVGIAIIGFNNYVL